MTLYYDTKVQFTDPDVISTISVWHQSLPLLAVGSFIQEKGGIVTIFHETGSPLEGCEWPTFLNNQATALAWHPTRRLLVVGWDNGDLYIWLEGTWARLEAPHTAALALVTFSTGGGRLITADSSGSVSGWRSNAGAPLTSFHHQLGETITHVAFCLPKASGEGVIWGLAKAAVAGDEGALDALAAWRPRTTARVREGMQADNHACYAAQESGVILYINASGLCSEVLNAPGIVKYMVTLPTGHILIAWESGGTLSLTRFATDPDGSIQSEMHVRMSSRSGQAITFAGTSTIAVIAGELLVRLWDCQTGENDVLPANDGSPTHGDMLTSISYCNLSDTLCCGSSHGNVYLWRRDPRNQWKLISATAVKGTVKDVCWGSEAMLHPLLSVNCITNVLILREQPLCWAYTRNLWVVQKAATEVALKNKTGSTENFSVSVAIKAIAFKGQYLALTDGTKIQVYSNSKDSLTKFNLLHTFSWRTDILFIHDDILIGYIAPYIESKSLSGSQLGLLPTAEGEGEPIAVTNTNKYLAIATMDGCIKIAEISRKGLKLSYPSKNCYQIIDDFGEIMHLSVNLSGRFVALSVANAGLAPDPRVYLYDAANDALSFILLTDNVTPPYFSVPVSIIWDDFDARLLAVHMRSGTDDKIHLLFADENKLEEHKDWSDSDEKLCDFMLCSMNAPYVIILKDQNIKRLPLREFAELKDPDLGVTRQILDFLFNMTIGQLEKAVLAGGSLAGGKSNAVWNGLAKACVARKRPDVGAVCLAKMGDAKGALMMRKIMTDIEFNQECQVAMLAIILGMTDEAESIFNVNNRPELVSRLVAAKDGGLAQLAESNREGEAALLLKSAQYKLAKSLWASGEIGPSIRMFERSGTQVPHVPRMLIGLGQSAALEQHVKSSQDPALTRWWGQYLESVGDLDGALDAYTTIEDYGERVRLLCHMQRLEEAEELAGKSRASAYHLARHYEMQPDKVEMSIKLYMGCGAISSALRVASETSAWRLVWRAGSCNSATPAHAGHAAAMLEQAGEIDHAISLYQKAGKLHSAVALALKTGREGALASLAESLSPGAEPELASRLAKYLMSEGHTGQAAVLLASAGKYEAALTAWEEDSAQSCELTEELGERLAPPAGTEGRTVLLRRLADLLGTRGLYHAAAKRLAQAGDKAGAMRWLLRSGDNERIASFAAASRDRGAQLLAAQHLRARAPWRQRPDLLRHIVAFYTRARAYRHLASFYADCAKLEIDEYQNYEKAQGALGEAIRCLGRAADPETGPETAALHEQAALVRRYLDVKKLFEAGDYRSGVSAGRQLLSTLDGEGNGLLRIEDLLRMMVQYAGSSGNQADAAMFQEKLQSLQVRQADPSDYSEAVSDNEIQEDIQETV